MKRFIAALSLSVASTAVLAQNGKPFELTKPVVDTTDRLPCVQLVAR